MLLLNCLPCRDFTNPYLPCEGGVQPPQGAGMGAAAAGQQQQQQQQHSSSDSSRANAAVSAIAELSCGRHQLAGQGSRQLSSCHATLPLIATQVSNRWPWHCEATGSQRTIHSTHTHPPSALHLLAAGHLRPAAAAAAAATCVVPQCRAASCCPEALPAACSHTGRAAAAPSCAAVLAVIVSWLQ
jgi:hypothetical protein